MDRQNDEIEIDIARIAELADRHGAQLSHWPRDEAVAARAVLAASAEARDVLARADQLDRILSMARTRSVSVNLRERILSAAPGGGWRELLTSLWPFGSVWRPAAALFGAAITGIFIGLTDAATLALPISVNGALSEEIHVVAMSGIDILGDGNQWQK